MSGPAKKATDPVTKANWVLESTDKPQSFKQRLEAEAPELLLRFEEEELAIEFYDWLKKAWAENQKHSNILSKREIPNRWFKLVRLASESATGRLVLRYSPLFDDESEGRGDFSHDETNLAAGEEAGLNYNDEYDGQERRTTADDETDDEEDVRIESDDSDATEDEDETQGDAEVIFRGKNRMDVDEEGIHEDETEDEVVFKGKNAMDDDEEEMHEAPLKRHSIITSHQSPGLDVGFAEPMDLDENDEDNKEEQKSRREPRKTGQELFRYPEPPAHTVNRKPYAYHAPSDLQTTPYSSGRKTFNTNKNVKESDKETRAQYGLPLPANVYGYFMTTHLVNHTYPRTWMKDNHIKPEAAEVENKGSLTVLSKMKMEEMPAHGILLVGDEFYMEYEDGGLNLEVTAKLNGLTSDKRAILEFNGLVDEHGNQRYALCKGPMEVVSAFMYLQDKIDVKNPAARAWKVVNVRHGTDDFGSLHRMRQEYELFKLEMDDWSEKSGAEWRTKAVPAGKGKKGASGTKGASGKKGKQ